MAQLNNFNKDNVTAQIREYRDHFNQLGMIYAPSSAVDVKNQLISDIPCYLFLPHTIKNDDIIIYLHGGSFALGSIYSHHSMLSHFAEKFQRAILYVEYSLAPEYPFPNGRDDFIKVYKAVLDSHRKGNVFLIGDSAGCSILLNGLSELSAGSLKPPDGIVLISPWLDLTCENESFESRRNSDPILTKRELKKFAEYYSPGDKISSGAAQLIFKSLPPILLLVGSNEVLYDDTRHFYDKARQLQPCTEMVEFENQTHVWLLTDIHSESSHRAMDKIAVFMDQA